jgi:hypothetical protein
MITLIASNQFFTSSFQFQKALKSTVIAVSFILPVEAIIPKVSYATEVAVPIVTKPNRLGLVSKEYVKSSSGIEYYDYTIGEYYICRCFYMDGIGYYDYAVGIYIYIYIYEYIYIYMYRYICFYIYI